MNFPFVVVAIILVCLTVDCNGQFKILGLLNNGENVENIRSLVDDVEPLSVDSVKASELEKIKDLENIESSAKGNVNFIKPLEASVTFKNDRKTDFVEATSAATEKIPITGTTTTNSENVFNEISPGRSEASILELSTARSTTTIASKSYRKTIRPNIRKFSYIEARSFHHPDSPNHVTPRNDYKYINVVKYRNKYKSKCRCERIWNCPKIQISIQRCEPDYFMCCF